MKKIVITGVHVTPAIAVMEVLRKKDWQIFYIGRKFAFEGDKTESPEAEWVREAGGTFLPLTTGRLQRYFSRHTIPSLIKIKEGYKQARNYLLEIKPDIILSFGGYVAAPVALAGFRLKIPVVTHEQTLKPGLSNRFIGKFAKKICVSWKETITAFPAKKTILTGNPLRRDIFTVKSDLSIPKEETAVYITGGSQGSQAINSAVGAILEQLLEKFTVIHQCGNAYEGKDLHHLEDLKSKLPAKLQKKYFPLASVGPDLIGWVLRRADLMISRCGANTMTEVIMLTKPTLFIPLPWTTTKSEQEYNAQFMSNAQAALVLNQKDLTPERLLQVLLELSKNKQQYILALEKLKSNLPNHPAEKIVSVVESLR